MTPEATRLFSDLPVLCPTAGLTLDVLWMTVGKDRERQG